jgi:hypothetical protein
MDAPKEGCALCGATWGDYWTELDGKTLFFCCDICAKQYVNIVGEVKKRTGWAQLGDIKMEGNYRGRICTAFSEAESLRFMISFFENGDVRSFVELG